MRVSKTPSVTYDQVITRDNLVQHPVEGLLGTGKYVEVVHHFLIYILEFGGTKYLIIIIIIIIIVICG
jgi:hypothetical protein